MMERRARAADLAGSRAPPDARNDMLMSLDYRVCRPTGTEVAA